jgi:outer membrane immunogenic protein
MSRFVWGALVLIGAGWTMSAQAADLGYGRTYTSNQRFDYFSWAGPYLGGNLGYAWGSVANNPTKPSGVAGGVQAGYNWQQPGSPWVFGIEGDIQATGAEETFAPWKFSNPWWGTLRGRAGVAWQSFLFYGTGGLAYGDVKGETGVGLTETHTLVGWALGAGVEVGLNRQWSAKAEYLYVDLGNHNYTVTGVNNGYWSNVLRLGVNYRF